LRPQTEENIYCASACFVLNGFCIFIIKFVKGSRMPENLFSDILAIVHIIKYDKGEKK